MLKTLKITAARFLYIKKGLGARGDKQKYAPRKNTLYGQEDYWWDKRLEPHFLDERREVAPHEGSSGSRVIDLDASDPPSTVGPSMLPTMVNR
jgi:hypothetical protein